MENKDQSFEELKSSARVILIMGGTYLVSKGWFSMAELNDIVGALLILGSFGWSQYRIYKRKQAAKGEGK